MKVPNIKKSKVKKEVLMPPFCGGDFYMNKMNIQKIKKAATRTASLDWVVHRI